MEDLNIINDDPIFIQHMTEEDDREAICIAKYKKEFIEEGYEQGKFEIAKKMLKENIDIETVSKITELSIEEIKKL